MSFEDLVEKAGPLPTGVLAVPSTPEVVGTDKWWTPPWMEARAVATFDNEIELDPATCIENPMNASRFWTEEDNGLVKPWDVTRGGIWLNPPWSRKLGLPIEPWLKRAAEYGAQGMPILALVPAATETKWWNWITTADAVLFLKGRVRYIDPVTRKPVGTPKWPSAVAYWGDSAKRFRRAWAGTGWCP